MKTLLNIHLGLKRTLLLVIKNKLLAFNQVQVLFLPCYE